MTDDLMRFSHLITICLCILTMATCRFAIGDDAAAVRKKILDRPEFAHSIDGRGIVDYAQAVNTHLGAGILPEDNVAALLYQAIGPRPRNRVLSPRLFERLGISQPNADGRYFTAFPDFQSTDIEVDGEPPERPWMSNEYTRTDAWLEANRYALEIVDQAVQRPQYFLPLDPQLDLDGHETGIPLSQLHGCQQSREIATALIARGMKNFYSRSPRECWDQLFACHMLGRHLSHGTTFIGQLVGYAIEDRAVAAELVWLSKSHCTTADIDRAESDLQHLQPLGSISRSINVCERAAFLEAIQMLRNERLRAYNENVNDGGWNRAQLLFWTNACRGNIESVEMVKMVNFWVDRMVEAQRLKTYPERKRAITKLREKLRQISSKLVNANMGDFWSDDAQVRRANVSGFLALHIIHAFSGAMMGGFEAESRTVQRTTNFRLALALKKHLIVKGGYPGTLEELVPEFIEAVPRDEFSGKCLIYKPTKDAYTLYSVGDNLIDDGGKSYDESKDDIVVMFPK